MAYNIHPLFVHFPIALLFIYSAIKIVPLRKWFPTVSWVDIERALLAFGVLGAFAALSTGETAENLIRPNRQLVNMHADFATVATWMYGLLLSGEAAAILLTKNITYGARLSVISRVLKVIERVLRNRTISIVLAIAGLLTLSIAGLLGGVMVYGTSADPVAGFVISMLGITL
jgi:uncharacterized membrane protein